MDDSTISIASTISKVPNRNPFSVGIIVVAAAAIYCPSDLGRGSFPRERGSSAALHWFIVLLARFVGRAGGEGRWGT